MGQLQGEKLIWGTQANITTRVVLGRQDPEAERSISGEPGRCLLSDQGGDQPEKPSRFMNETILGLLFIRGKKHNSEYIKHVKTELAYVTRKYIICTSNDFSRIFFSLFLCVYFLIHFLDQLLCVGLFLFSWPARE